MIVFEGYINVIKITKQIERTNQSDLRMIDNWKTLIGVFFIWS